MDEGFGDIVATLHGSIQYDPAKEKIVLDFDAGEDLIDLKQID